MSKAFSCPRCGRTIVVRYLKAGEQAKCHTCGALVSVPETAAEESAQEGLEAGPGAPAEYAPSAPPSAPPVLEKAAYREGDCLNHAGVPAVTVCTICAEPFCATCVDAPGPAARCFSCNPLFFRGAGVGVLPRTLAQPVPCPTAREALIMSLVGLVCFGIILEPLALYRALKAKKEIRESQIPMTGDGKATAAIVISSIVLGMWGLWILLLAVAAALR